jgi:hypothetical protein
MTCVNECVASVDRALCETYCDCGYRYARDHDRLEELNHTSAPAPGQPMPPVLVDLMAECGSDVFDASFSNECVRTCSTDSPAATCTTRCDCLLRELRGPGPRNASTRFLVENLTPNPATPLGQARRDAAQRVCNPPVQ